MGVGYALQSIRDDRLYRATHSTVEAYCRERWEMPRQRANQLIAASGVVTCLQLQNDDNCCQTPATESQARQLTALPPDQQCAAWSQREACSSAADRPRSLCSFTLAMSEVFLRSENWLRPTASASGTRRGE